MKIVLRMLLILPVCGLLFSSADFMQSYGHWRCSQPRNQSLVEVVSDDTRRHFDAIGYSAWMVDKRTFISCYERGLISVPKGLDKSVQLLDLRRNSIIHLTKNDFSEYTKLEAIMLQENCFSANIFHDGIPSCSYDYMKIDLNAFADLSRLNHLSLAKNKIKKVPLNLPKSLKILDMEMTELGQISTNDVKQLADLELVMMGKNCIEAAYDSLCKGNFSIENFHFSSINLTSLDFSFSNLRRVPSWIFTRTLLSINLQTNPIHVVHFRDFKACPQVKYLVLSWTAKFDKIPLMIMNGAFDALTKLVDIDLSGNMLSTIPDFTSHTKLTAIKLDFNCLELSANNPTNLSALPLTKLELIGNTFCDNETYPVKTRIPTFKLGNAFCTFQKLKSLKFDGFTSVSMPDLDEIFWILSYGFQYDYIDEESLQVLQKLPSLKTLSLTLSGIKSVDMSMFCKFNLTRLDLGINEIKDLSINASAVYRRSRRNIEQREKNKYSSLELLHFFNLRKQSIYLNQNEIMLILHRNALTDISNDAFKCFSKTTYLDLSYNHISYIPGDTFASMTHLEKLNLQYNPVRQIYPGPQNGLSKLNTLMLNYAAFQGEFTLKFLLNATSEIKLNYGDVTDNIYRLLSAYRKNSTTFRNVVSITFSNIPILLYDVLNNEPIFKPFPNLRHVTLTNAYLTITPKNNFFGGVPKVTNVALCYCKLQQFPDKALAVLPTLRYVDLSHNYIESLNQTSFGDGFNLTFLSVSHNFITHIDPNLLHNLVKRGLKHLDLSYNFIKDVRHSIIDQYMLSQLLYLDLRKNSIRCDCSLTRNFGQLIKTKAKQLQIPGFLPVCPSSVDNYYGGCLKCNAAEGFLNQPPSLFLYSLSNICQEQFLTILTAGFSAFIVIFLILSLLLDSKSLKNRLVKSYLQTHLGQTAEESVKASDSMITNKLYAFDGFIVYDTNDSVIGDWVDFTMLSELESGFPSFKIGVVEKEDWSGLTSEVQQLLLRMKASYKTIVLLSNQFARSVKCKYVLGVLEQWVYTKGEDRCIIVTFQNHPSTAQGFQMRRRRNKWSTLNLSDLNADNAVFFELLRHAIAAKRFQK